MKKFKKYLPFILLGVGILFIIVVILIVRKNKSTATPTPTEAPVITLPLGQRPIASLTPSADGHWLHLTVIKIVSQAASMDYELLYQLPDGRTQGVPGTIKLTGQTSIDRDLLMGSESSGKFKYDEGVKQGTLNLRFRDENGKLITKFSTEFALLSGTDTLTSVDQKITYTLPRVSSNFFVVMETFGVPFDSPATVVSGPFGIFSSSKLAIPGVVKLNGTNLYMAGASSWTKLDSGKSSNVGIFLGTQ